MSVRRTIILGVAAIAVATVIYASAAWYRNNQAREQLKLARQELQAVLAAKDARQQRAHARACVGIAQPLITESDPNGATAALFAIAAAPLVEATLDISVPEASRVESLPTNDLLLIAEALFETGRIVPADQLMDLALSRQDEYRQDVLVLAAAIRLNLGRDAEVLQYCDELIAMDDTAASPYRMQAAVFRLHAKWDHYVRALENAQARMNQTDPSMLVELIDGYIRIGRFDEANRRFDELSSKYPEFAARAPTVHARLLIQKGEFEEAGQVLSNYLKTDPSDTEVLVLEGEILLATEKAEQAVEVLKTALQHDPSAHDAHYQIAQAYARVNQKELADKHLKTHRKLLDSKVHMYALEQQAAREPDNYAVRRELADMYSEIGIPELADFWERAANVLEAKQ